jgi:hypothetical protein
MAGYLRDLRARYAHHRSAGCSPFPQGDDSVGSVFDALIGDCPKPLSDARRLSPLLRRGIDACALGNHDLDLGPRLLAQALLADAPTSRCSRPIWPAVPGSPGSTFPAALFVVKGLRVAVIGLTTPGQIAPHPDSTLHSGRSHRGGAEPAAHPG